MNAGPRPWPVTGYLDALRPDPGWEVEFAIVAAYSADPVSIVAALLALIGRDDEARPPSRRDLADAVEALRDRVRVVVQRGRFAKMRQPPRLTGVLDQFVRDVPFDERQQSWHPKAALVRLRRGSDVEWRLWVGSRNLTMSENRDLGLLLISGRDSRGRSVPGAEDIAASLAGRADLPNVAVKRLSAQVTGLKWRAPPGVRVDRLRISSGQSDWVLPKLPKTVDALTVVSPFLDAGFLNHLAETNCGDDNRKLLSTLTEIERLAATTSGFGTLLVLEAPDYAAAAPSQDGVEIETQALEGEEIGRGLHAKLLHVREGERRRIWMGSANATKRAWTGRNVEIIAELTVDKTAEEGLLALLEGARPLKLKDRDGLVDADPQEDRLERARAELSANWQAEINWDADGLRLHHLVPPHPSDPDIQLEAGLITTDVTLWPTGQTALDLGLVEEADRTELVQLRLTLEGAACEWIVRATATPPFGEARDRAAFMRSMGVREFLLWVADSLRGAAVATDEPDWTTESSSSDFHSDAVSWADGLPTQEEILSAWTRDPALFETVRRRIRTFLPALLDHTRVSDPEGHKRLQSFDALWTTLEQALGDRS